MTDGYNTKLFYGESDPTTEIPKLRELTPPAIEVDDVETSHMQTPGKVKTFKGGWADPGSLTGQCEFDPDVYGNLLGAAGEDYTFKVELSDGSELTFDGYIKSVGVSVEREGLVLVDFTVKVSGQITFKDGDGEGGDL